VLLTVVENSVAVWLNAFDALVSIGLGTALFVILIKTRQDVNKALVLILIFQIGYCFLRGWLFAPTLATISQQMTPMYESYLSRFPNLKINSEMIAYLQNFMLKYQSAIWGTLQITAVFLGLLLFNRISHLKLQIRSIKIPYHIIYLMIIALALTVMAKTRIWGINLLICMSVMYLIQGTAVLSHFWGDFFTKARLLRTLLIMSIIINYPVLVLIALVGTLDVWFDFRKLNKLEEKHESDIN